MRRILPLIAILVLAAAPAMAASRSSGRRDARANWPTRGQIEKAEREAKFASDHTAKFHMVGKTIEFVPADISGYKDHEIAAGVIFGVLDTRNLGRESKDGLPAGRYHVYVRKELGAWEAYFVQDHQPVYKSRSVKAGEHDNHDPRFTNEGHSVEYWYLTFDW